MPADDDKLAIFDKSIRELTGQHELARPFLCYGLPFGCDVFLVGINPGTDTGFWQHWNPVSGCDKRGWLDGYLAQHGKYGPTRKRIEVLFDILGHRRCLETNVFMHFSKQAAQLASTRRDTRVFKFLLQTLRPRLVFVHGVPAIDHLETLIGDGIPLLVRSELPRCQFATVDYRGITFDVVAGEHLSRNWKDSQVLSLAEALKVHLDSGTTVRKNNPCPEQQAAIQNRPTDVSTSRVASKSSEARPTLQHLASKASNMGPLTKRQRDILHALKILRQTKAWATRVDIGGITGFEKGYSKALGSPTRGKIPPDSLEGRQFVERRDMVVPFEYRITEAGLKAIE